MPSSQADSTTNIRFAMIGCGRMGRHHSEKMIEDGRGEVVALFDAQPSMAERLKADLWPSAWVAKTFDELMSREGIDAAIICTPTAEHYLQSKACLSHGWHVLCEKPLASNREQILELMRLADEATSK
ncbi:MAG: Gfo/Idh/MocA family oxidoreductase, partial [Schlesneria sp.]